MAAITDVTDDNFQAEVIESDKPVLVDFWAPWCGPCRIVHPVLEQIAAERGEDLKIVKLNTDENPRTAATFEVLSIPTLILFKGGQVAKKIIGALRAATLRGQKVVVRRDSGKADGTKARFSKKPSREEQKKRQKRRVFSF
jgi:thioredoxin 1